ncbi:MAG: DUF5063 domain-containing protein, partial [Mangrovibacterium sp.]
MTEEELNPVVYSREVLEFVTVANAYCQFVEEAGRGEARGMLDKARKLLPLLYLKSCVIPAFESTEELVPGKFVT